MPAVDSAGMGTCVSAIPSTNGEKLLVVMVMVFATVSIVTGRSIHLQLHFVGNPPPAVDFQHTEVTPGMAWAR